ncbi:unnamed protein product [Timema podura]|uniref:CIZ1 C2H2-type zinc finger domain-containing protein n=1 Tax=Timema podura TaxID=61482 RepID=A0ABN7PLB1_TIMPD|nr:unnamed protein product [Timema podura]
MSHPLIHSATRAKRQPCFDKHLTGRPHTETFERQREGYKLKTLLLRKKLKLNTEKMELELDNPQPKKPRIQQFCAMCDTHYYGGVVLHRRTWDHQVGTTCRTCSHETCHTVPARAAALEE